ncbi:MAG: ribose 5-phosphate isomerase B [Clostridiales bacterium GWE2_32_10]|nr:MAG: ribose 5-phosphate isomerase B [Clostridiales bacterium GWE2_32_10]HBY19590.1 ribose 5-phosphate isomerase B [Clostridiales bacterium]
MIAIGSDHAGFEIKKEIIKYLESKGIELYDCGAYEYNSEDDYPDFAYKVAEKVAVKECEFGVLICGTGIGVSIVANKVRGVRAAACSEPLSARLSREHNDANVIAFGARIVGIEMAKAIVDSFLSVPIKIEHRDKDERRMDEIRDIEQKRGF